MGDHWSPAYSRFVIVEMTQLNPLPVLVTQCPPRRVAQSLRLAAMRQPTSLYTREARVRALLASESLIVKSESLIVKSESLWCAQSARIYFHLISRLTPTASPQGEAKGRSFSAVHYRDSAAKRTAGVGSVLSLAVTALFTQGSQWVRQCASEKIAEQSLDTNAK